MESRHCEQNILLSCPQCLDSMLAPGFWNKAYSLDQFLLICCSKVAKEGKGCSRLLALQKVAQNFKSCSKVQTASHNVCML